MRDIKFTNVASSTPFDNSTNGFNGDNVQDALEEAREGQPFQFVTFQFLGQMSFSQYLYAGVHSDSGMNRRSGDTSNGYRFSNSAPLVVNKTGVVDAAAVAITGIAQSTATPAANMELKFELWKVGFANEGTLLGDIIFNVVSANYTIGNFQNSSILTGFGENQPQNINVEAGDLIGVKFIRVLGNNRVSTITNVTLNLEIRETL